MYKKCHSAIRSDPVFSKKPAKKISKKRWNKKKLTNQDRKDYVRNRKEAVLAGIESEA